MKHRASSSSASASVVQRLLGHAIAAMTLDRYAISNADLTGVAAALGKAIDTAAVPLRYVDLSKVAETV